MKRFFIAAALCVTVAAYGQQAPKLNEGALKESMDEHLKDASSARFRNIQYKPSNAAGMWNMCGEVNAKNSFGGYGGYEPFLGFVVREGKSQPSYVVLRVGGGAKAVCESLFG